jgi:hypothetical protein
VVELKRNAFSKPLTEPANGALRLKNVFFEEALFQSVARIERAPLQYLGHRYTPGRRILLSFEMTLSRPVTCINRKPFDCSLIFS